MKRSVYISPSAKRGVGYPNPYFYHLKDELARYVTVLDRDNRPCLMQGTALLRHSLRADVFLLSFTETVAFHKLPRFQSLLVLLSLDIMRWRGRKIIYFFHNPRPHQGENRLSRWLTRLLLQRADRVLTHSENAAAVAARSVPPGKVLLRPHPLVEGEGGTPSDRRDGILIWGTILPYKGIYEFLSDPRVRSARLQVEVVGACADEELDRKIRSVAGETVRYENRRASLEEIAGKVRASRFVLFPYLEGSISGSGVLMDTLSFGGTPVGPDIGAFHDLAAEGLCLVYSDREELLEILRSDRDINPARREAFIRENSWPAFAQWLASLIDSLF